jgi:hypothetical protein
MPITPPPTSTAGADPQNQGPLSAIGKFLGNAFNAFKPQTGLNPQSPQNPGSSSGSPYYQIKASDITGGMSGIAKNQGVNYQDLSAANPGLKTLSKGTYLTIPSKQAGAGAFANMQTPNPNLGSVYPGRSQSQSAAQEVQYLNQQAAQNPNFIPPAVSDAAVRIQGGTTQDMVAAGYVRNSSNTGWVQSNAGGNTNTGAGRNINQGGGNANAWQGNSRVVTQGGGGRARKVTKERLGYNSNRGGGGQTAVAPVAPVASNAGGTAIDVLASKLGSG